MKAKHRAPFACIFFLILSAGLQAIIVAPSSIGNVFSAGETVSIPVTADPGSTSMSWIVTDYFGRQVSTGAADVFGGSVTLRPSTGGEVGYFGLSLTELNGRTTIATAATAFAIVPPPADRTNSPFGVQTHFAQGMPTEITQLMVKAGIVQFRDEQYWDQIETLPSIYIYPASVTDYMKATATAGLQPLITLDWANPLYDWSAGIFTGPYTASGLAGYGNYALNVVQQSTTSNPVNQVEVWDEYNGGSFIAGPATSDKPLYYTQMLERVWNAVKPRFPDVKIVAGAVVPVDQGFIQSIIDQGANAYFDVVSVHPYRSVPEGVDVELAALEDVIKAGNGGAAKPIWATEFGMDASGPADTFAQVSYLVRMIALMQAGGVSRMYYYCMQDDSVTPYMGLVGEADPVQGDYLPNPAYPAYAWLINKLYNSSAEGRITGHGLAPTTYIYSYTNSGNGDRTYVCWGGAGNSPAPTTVTFTIPTSTAVLTDVMGNDTVLTANNGQVSVPLALDPVYVTVPGAQATDFSEAPNSVVADSIASYAKTQGADGWYYGYAKVGGTYDPAAFTPLAWDFWQGGQMGWGSDYPYIQAEVMHPYADASSNVWAVRRWQSDTAGTATLSGTITGPEAGSAGVIAHILVNGKEVYRQPISAGVTMNYSVPNVTVGNGDDIDFAVEAAAQTMDFDATSFTARISIPVASTPTSSSTGPAPTSSTSPNSANAVSSGGGTSGGSGGGAFDYWFLGVLAFAGLLRRKFRRT